MRGLNLLADRIGDAVFRMFFQLRASFELTFQSWLAMMKLRWLNRPAVTHVAIRQLYFTGVEGAGWVVGASALVGFLAVYNIVDFASNIKDLTLVGSMFSGLFLQELAPLMIAVFILVRSGVAVVTEVGNMQTRAEPFVLASLGISEHEYLYMPRLLAFAVSGLILTFVFSFLAVWFGALAVSFTHILSISEYLYELQRGVSFLDILIMLGKGVLYPVLMALTLITQGCKVGSDPNQIPVRAIHGMLGSLIFIILADIVIGSLLIFL